ncbi:MAG: hypothetical protein IH586_07020 [Anaerolineaceae bacterium]|nr:hypothetical protein [Anaerolineaceae bacterium]
MEPKETHADWLVSIGQGAAWIITAAGVLLSAIFIREAEQDILAWYGVRHLKVLQEGGEVGKALETNTQLRTIDNFVIFILACLAVWAVVEIEYYFRKGRPKGLLLKRILKVAGIEVGIIIGSVLLRMLITP